MRYAQLVEAPYNARLTLTTPAAVEPVEVAELRQHVRQDLGDDDDYLFAVVTAARQLVEQYLQRQLVTASWTLVLDSFPADGILELPRPPLQSVTSVRYYDTSRVLQTFAASNYYTHTFAGPDAPPGRLELADGAAWPTVFGGGGAVQVLYSAGYGASGVSVPGQIRQAVMLLAAELYERREQSIVGSSVTPVILPAERLLWPLRVM